MTLNAGDLGEAWGSESAKQYQAALSALKLEPHIQEQAIDLNIALRSMYRLYPEWGISYMEDEPIRNAVTGALIYRAIHKIIPLYSQASDTVLPDQFQPTETIETGTAYHPVFEETVIFSRVMPSNSKKLCFKTPDVIDAVQELYGNIEIPQDANWDRFLERFLLLLQRDELSSEPTQEISASNGFYHIDYLHLISEASPQSGQNPFPWDRRP